ncbi:MAG: hypothetical protein J7493_03435 [Porphyrobacter sp.]|nr:hypothetical protein [Porphyrobacter sp.]
MRALSIAALSLIFLALPAVAQDKLSSADSTAAFRAAGFKQVSGQWQGCEDPGTASYTPGEIAEVRDLNGDGQPEAIITEGSVFCFGSTEVGYVIVSKQADGSWKQVTGGPGIVNVLDQKGAGGWPDLEIGGPGFCFPVERWDGAAYVLSRHQYEGKACKPND